MTVAPLPRGAPCGLSIRIIAKAGLTPWPKLFQNLRITRETELAETNPLHVAFQFI